LRALKAVAENISPLIERVGKFLVNIQLGLDDLAGQRTETASLLIRALVGDVVIRPLPKGIQAVEPTEPFTAQEGQDAFGLPGDDGQDEVLLGGEVVVDLRSTNSGGAAEGFVVRGMNTIGVDEFRGVLQDPSTRRLALFGELARSSNRCHGVHSWHDIPNWA